MADGASFQACDRRAVIDGAFTNLWQPCFGQRGFSFWFVAALLWVCFEFVAGVPGHHDHFKTSSNRALGSWVCLQMSQTSSGQRSLFYNLWQPCCGQPGLFFNNIAGVPWTTEFFRLCVSHVVARRAFINFDRHAVANRASLNMMQTAYSILWHNDNTAICLRQQAFYKQVTVGPGPTKPFFKHVAVVTCQQVFCKHVAFVPWQSGPFISDRVMFKLLAVVPWPIERIRLLQRMDVLFV